ncbi:efflux RND transporter periplasmic adaptor subunit [Pseudohongiella sp. O18]|uniref:efflux RND transporter periplasmic adaptor subunit n=1 Tax=Pseudohongiella sp. O18 TaxID=2904248 RepID=UPI001F261A2F|nr:HlyD family efflux transporter periplasmic adaptor subunit [Pseudohongiella sp. O18]
MNEHDSRLQKLAVFIELEKRLRQCKDDAHLAFMLVNETHSLGPFRQAVLWQPSGGPKGRVSAVSGLAVPDASAPFASWVRSLAQELHQQGEESLSPQRISSSALSDDVAANWQQWLPSAAVWIPFSSSDGQLKAALIVARDERWGDADLMLFSYLSDSVSHIWQSLGKQHASQSIRKRITVKRRSLIAAACLVVVSLIPVSQTTLAPAEIIAKDPVIIRAGIDGVIDQISVLPNQQVRPGETLATLDARRLESQLEVARKALEVADAEYRQAAQMGLSDSRANANLAILKGRAEQNVAEIRYLESMLQRSEIKAPQAGVAVFNDRSEWEGRPVNIGERIMLLADPAQIELEIRLPVADAIALDPGARIRLFLNTDPHRPIEATLTFASYQADLTPEGILAYRLTASLNSDESRRIGLKGTAKVYGDRTLLILYVLRRPLTAIRQWTGF